MKTVIIGNGILACTTAFRLAQSARKGDSVVIIGKAAREHSATLAAAAMLNSFAEVEVGSLDSAEDKYRFELSRRAGAMWPAFEQEIVAAAGKKYGNELGGKFGTFIINNTAADDLDDANFNAIVAALKTYKEPYDAVDPRDIPNYMPEQRYRATRAIHIKNERWMNPRYTMEKLDAALASFACVQRVDAQADTLIAKGGKVAGVMLDNGQAITGDSYLLATGATASDLLARSKLGVNMQRVFYGVGTSIEIKSPDYPHHACVRTPNRGLACGIYSAPYFQGPKIKSDHILIGASNFISADPYHYGRLTSVENIMSSAMNQINRNFYRADLVRVNVGWRPTSQDTYPLVGPTSLKNLVIATGTKRDGFHLAPLFSEFIAAMLRNKTVEKKFAMFAPERPLIRNLTRAQAIEKAVRHLTSAAYQHGYSPSHSRMPEQVAHMQRDAVTALHDKVGAKDWGIPPEMLDMYRYGHAKP